MRLTKYLRECFVKAVFADIAEPKKPSFNELQAALYENFDPRIKAVYDDEELRKQLNTSYYHVSGTGGRSLVTGGQNYDQTPLFLSWTKADEAYRSAKASLRAVADGCTNLKQLQAALPELVKYMVSEEKPTPVNLPALTGTVDALKALGWKS